MGSIPSHELRFYIPHAASGLAKKFKNIKKVKGQTYRMRENICKSYLDMELYPEYTKFSNNQNF